MLWETDGATCRNDRIYTLLANTLNLSCAFMQNFLAIIVCAQFFEVDVYHFGLLLRTRTPL